MHFRICCCGDGGGNEKDIQNENTQQTSVVIEQPKPKATETIQLDKITEISERRKLPEEENTKEPSTTNIEESTSSVAKSSLQENENEPSTLTATSSSPQLTTPVNTFTPNLSSDSLNFNTTGNGETLTPDQDGPGYSQGNYKGRQFNIINGQFQSTDGADNELILKQYSQAMSKMEHGIKQMEAGMYSYTSLPVNSIININFIGRSGEKSVMTFKLIEPELFQSRYNGKEFFILNGHLITTDGVFDDLDRELILSNYSEALIGIKQGMLGMQQGMLGMQQGMLGMQQGMLGMKAGLLETNTDFMGINTSESFHNVLTTGRETLTRMRSLNHRNRPSILQEGLIAHPRQSSILIEDISEKPNNSGLFDEVDGGIMPTVSEPILTKTTFTPNAIVHEDPKMYEKLDKYELPIAKRLDDYIISMDESSQAANMYYFHAAKPRKVARKQLTPEEQLKIASLDRYTLFESESLKAHNECRKIHGIAPLVHNEFLCQVAREWAEYLALKDAFYHRPKDEYGENLYYAEKKDVCARKAVKAWYDEIDLYDYNDPKFSKETGHFTQLVWKDTRELGTGVAQIGDKIWVCCNYHPPGNFMGKFNDEFVPRPLIKRVKKP